MSIIDELAELSSAEDFFAFLDVAYDPAVVHVSRLHIMRRMGQYLKGSQIDGVFESKSDDEVKTLCRDHLATAYEDFVTSSPIQERIFQVHKDAVGPKETPAKPFVPMASITAVQTDGKSAS